MPPPYTSCIFVQTALKQQRLIVRLRRVALISVISCIVVFGLSLGFVSPINAQSGFIGATHKYDKYDAVHGVWMFIDNPDGQDNSRYRVEMRRNYLPPRARMILLHGPLSAINLAVSANWRNYNGYQFGDPIGTTPLGDHTLEIRSATGGALYWYLDGVYYWHTATSDIVPSDIVSGGAVGGPPTSPSGADYIDVGEPVFTGYWLKRKSGGAYAWKSWKDNYYDLGHVAYACSKIIQNVFTCFTTCTFNCQ